MQHQENFLLKSPRLGRGATVRDQVYLVLQQSAPCTINYPQYMSTESPFSLLSVVRYTQHSVLVLDGVLRRLQIRENHLLHERVEVDLALPPEQLLRLCGVAEEQAGII